MKRVHDKMIKEKVLLSNCKENDQITINHPAQGTRYSIGTVILKKVKPIGRGMLQIKYYPALNKKILKADVPDKLRVERTRKATSDDFQDSVPTEHSPVSDNEPPRAPQGSVDILDPLPRLREKPIGETSRHQVDDGFSSYFNALMRSNVVNTLELKG